MRTSIAIALLAAAVTASAHANETSVGLAASVESLDNGASAWRETSLQLRHAFAPRQQLDVSLAETERFDLRDTQLSASYATPISSRLTASIHASTSPTHRVLAQSEAGGGFQYEFAPAWLLHLGTRSRKYNAVRVNEGMLMVEHYVSAFSWSAGWRPARAYGTTVHSAELRGSYYYGDNDSIGIILAAGREAANVGTNVVVSDVRSVALVGRHRLERNWTLNYGAAHTRQGDFYSRNGINLGVQYTF